MKKLLAILRKPGVILAIASLVSALVGGSAVRMAEPDVSQNCRNCDTLEQCVADIDTLKRQVAGLEVVGE